MGSPLGPTLIVFFNISPVDTGRKLRSVSTGMKKNWLSEYPPQLKPVVYRCYVDDIPFVNYINKKK